MWYVIQVQTGREEQIMEEARSYQVQEYFDEIVNDEIVFFTPQNGDYKPRKHGAGDNDTVPCDVFASDRESHGIDVARPMRR